MFISVDLPAPFSPSSAWISRLQVEVHGLVDHLVYAEQGGTASNPRVH